jgi:hypothetical protein
MKVNTFYSHYKSKAIHRYKKMHGGMNARYNYL